MGKLNIAHHKSYHPYRRDNIERVRKDEEEARQKEAVEEGRMMLADSEARIDLLRQRAGLTGSKRRGRKGDDDDMAIITDPSRRRDVEPEPAQARPSTLTAANGHINLFEDLEQQSMAMMVPVRSTKRAAPTDRERDNERETDKGVALAPSAKDLNPWYSDRDPKRSKDKDPKEDGKRMRDLVRKSAHDPLTSINSQLAARDRPASASASSSSTSRRPRPNTDRPAPSAPADATTERQSRESAERQRALELIRRKKREMAGSETPSTVRGGSGYGDVFNRRELDEVHRARRDRGWERGHERR